MLPILLAQLIETPLQPSPVRLPASQPTNTRPRSSDNKLILNLPNGSPGSDTDSKRKSKQNVSTQALPKVRNLTIYSDDQLRTFLSPCLSISNPRKRLDQCAAALTGQFRADGYINSRVYVSEDSSGADLIAKEGILTEIRVINDQPRLAKKVGRLLKNKKGQILNIVDLENQLQLLRKLPNILQIRGNLSKLGSDPQLATLRLDIESRGSKWMGGISLRNDGNSGSGDARTTASLVKQDLITYDDTFLIYGELSGDLSDQLGSGIISLTYRYPFADTVSLTTSLGYSKNKQIELEEPLDGLATDQLQGLVQLDWAMVETLQSSWSSFVGISINDNKTTLDNRSLPSVVPEIVREPRTSYLKVGVNGSHQFKTSSLSTSAYFLQGLNSFSNGRQINEWDAAGITPTSARALGGVVSGSRWLTPTLRLNAKAAGQIALNPLLPSMQFSLGSDIGLRGLPGQLISGDSGWVSTAELPWTFWRDDEQAVQLVPFFGVGGVRTKINASSFKDTLGSTGAFIRYLPNSNWIIELGYAHQFETDDNLGPWDDWVLDDGLYAKASFRF